MNITEKKAAPEIVCLCGSTRFGEAFQAANLKETLAGKIVLSIGCNMKSDSEIFGHLPQAELDEIKIRLDELHKRKIDLSDEVLVLNVGGYIGDSTRSEIEYAEANHVPVRYLEPLMWECPTCHHVMTEEQSKGYAGCPTGFHPVRHKLVHAGVVLMQDGATFSHFDKQKPPGPPNPPRVKWQEPNGLLGH